jgi:hypothetical protein
MKVPSPGETLEHTTRAPVVVMQRSVQRSTPYYFYYCCYYRGVPAFFRFQFIFRIRLLPSRQCVEQLEIYTLLLSSLYMFFFSFTEGDKSTEMSICKCCDIKNDNGKNATTITLHTLQKYVLVRSGTLIYSYTQCGFEKYVFCFISYSFTYYYYVFFFSWWLSKKKKGKNDEQDCQLYSPRTKKINK